MRTSFWSKIFLAIIALAFILMCASCDKEDCQSEIRNLYELHVDLTEAQDYLHFTDSLILAGAVHCGTVECTDFLKEHEKAVRDVRRLKADILELKADTDCF